MKGTVAASSSNARPVATCMNLPAISLLRGNSMELSMEPSLWAKWNREFDASAAC